MIKKLIINSEKYLGANNVCTFKKFKISSHFIKESVVSIIIFLHYHSNTH